MGPIDSALFKIKMDIMLIKSEVMQLKDELADYVSNIVNLHLAHLKSRLDKKAKVNEDDCELGLQGEAEEYSEDYEEEDSEENDSDGELSEEPSEELTDEELAFSEEDDPLKEPIN